MFEIKPKLEPRVEPEQVKLPSTSQDDVRKALGAGEADIPAMAKIEPLSLAAEPDGRQAPIQVSAVVNGRNISYSTQLPGQGPEIAALSDTQSAAGLTVQSARFSQYTSFPETVDTKGYSEQPSNRETAFKLNGRSVVISQSEPEAA